MATPTSSRISNVADLNYAEAIGTYLDYLINQRGYTCIRYFIMVNEPNYEVGDWDRWQSGIENVSVKVMDGTLGWRAQAPYGAILVTAGAPEIPEKLKEQLTIGGILVIPVGDRFGQKMVRIIREGEEIFKQSEHGYFSFVPLLKGKSY